MTCQDCLLYMRTEENSPHQSVDSIDSIVCGLHQFKQKGVYGIKQSWKQCGCRGWPLSVVEMCEHCLVVSISFVFYTINEKCQLEVCSIFYCGSGSWSQCVCTQILLFTPQWPPFSCLVWWCLAECIIYSFQPNIAITAQHFANLHRNSITPESSIKHNNCQHVRFYFVMTNQFRILQCSVI